MADARPFPILTTPRLVLRQPTEADAAGLHRISWDDAVMRYYGMAAFRTPEDALQEIAWAHRIWDQDEGIRWTATFADGDGAYIGDLGFHNWSHEHARAEVGYKLERAYWRRGLMTEAMRAVLAYGFGTMNLNRVEALVDPRNEASGGLLASLGFTREGVLRDYEFERGGYVDLAMYALLRREWGDFLQRIGTN